MPTQADIRNYIVPANNNVESTSQVMNLADSVHSEFVREAFKNKNDETYGIFHMLVDYLAQRMVVEGGGYIREKNKSV